MKGHNGHKGEVPTRDIKEDEDGAFILPAHTHAQRLQTTPTLAIGEALQHECYNPVLRNAFYHDVAIRILSTPNPARNFKAIAAALGVTTTALRTHLGTPEFQQIYTMERERYFGNISEAIRSEKVPSYIRRSALVTRAQTVLGELLDAVQRDLAKAQENGTMTSAERVKAGAALVNAALTHLDKDSAANTKQGSTTTTINITADRAALIQNTLVESGVDLSDMLPPALAGSGRVDE